MNSGRPVRVVPHEGSRDATQQQAGGHRSTGDWPQAPLSLAIGRTRDWLLERQDAAGFWVAELEGDTILESEYILLLAYLGRHRSSAPAKPRVISRTRNCRPAAGRSIPADSWTPAPASRPISRSS